MGLLRRNGKEPGHALVPIPELKSGRTDDGWADTAEAKAANSGIWIVVRLSTAVPEGDWTTNRYNNKGHIEKAMLVRAADGIEAIKRLYDRDYKITEEDATNGRYIALDFYGGERVEALVTGEWRVKIDVAPPALGA